MKQKVILVILDGLGWQTARNLLGNIEGWVARGDAQLWKMQSVLPSTSGPCYVSIHTGLHPQTHGILSNTHQKKVSQADIFSEVYKAKCGTAAVAHSLFSVYFQDAPFDAIRDLEVNDKTRNIQHARFYTMTGQTTANFAIPSDFDLMTQATLLMQWYKPDYMLLHSSSSDSVNHAYGPESIQTDLNTYEVDSALSHYIPTWLENGYDIMITADHGHSARGHHGGTTEDMRHVAFYYFGQATGPDSESLLCQTQIAPSILNLLGINIPDSMQAKPFLTAAPLTRRDITDIGYNPRILRKI